MVVLSSGCAPETQPAVDVELREIATAAAANRVAGDELEVQLYFRPTRTMVTPFNGEVRRIAL